jgi:hypothetical protein
MHSVDVFTSACDQHEIKVEFDNFYDALYLDVVGDSIFIEAVKDSEIKLFIDTKPVVINKTYDQLVSTPLSDTISECRLLSLFA